MYYINVLSCIAAPQNQGMPVIRNIVKSYSTSKYKAIIATNF